MNSFVVLVFFLFNICFVWGDSRCDNEWIEIDCYCYLIATTKNTLITWAKAKDTCQKEQQSTLSRVEPQALSKLSVKSLKRTSWIGLRAKSKSPYFWLDGERAKFPNFALKNNTSPNPMCATVFPSNTWRAMFCGKKGHFICEQSAKSGKCPNGWKKFDNQSCFWLSPTSSSTFQEAKNNCSKRSATLAEITTKAEYDFVRKSLGEKDSFIQAWFGLHRPANKTKFTYSSEPESEPNYASIGVHFDRDSGAHGSKKSCTMIVLSKSDAAWEQKQCGHKLKSYICRKDIKKDFSIKTTDVNETSVNISWVMQPPSCSPAKQANLDLLIRHEASLVKSIKIKDGNSWKVVNCLKPTTNYSIEISGKNTRKTLPKAFRTSEIKNPLRVHKDISSTDVKAKIGDVVTLLCAAKGEPKITFNWEKDSKMVPSFSEQEKPHRISLLVIKLENNTSYGKYICHIEYPFGNTSHTIEIADIPKVILGENKSDAAYIAVTTILAILLVVLLIAIAYIVRKNQVLKRRVKESSKSSVKLTNVSKDSKVYDQPRDSFPKSKNKMPPTPPQEHDLPAENDAESYAALYRNQTGEEEDNYYTHLKDAPLYVNTSSLGV